MRRRLTPDQTSAVEAVEGDLAISAGAGSGKTTVLSRRFSAGMLARPDGTWEPADIDQILTITFTKKAAGEIAERVRRELSEDLSPAAARRIDEAWISTIHRLCGRLVRRHVLESGVEPGFGQADQVESALLMGEAFDNAASELYESDGDVSELPV
jgi:ATP-dependent helicase/nuclease subunit A